MRYILIFFLFFLGANSFAQVQWLQTDSLYGSLPSSFHVYRSYDQVNDKPNRMYYVSVKLDEPGLTFTSDTSQNRRLTPQQYFEKAGQPLLVVNASFFSFASNKNLNAVVLDGKMVSQNAQNIKGKGSDSSFFIHPFYGTFAILSNGKADVAWTFSDSSSGNLYASQSPVPFLRTKDSRLSKRTVLKLKGHPFSEWNVMTAVGGGPVLIQDGKVKITNNEERKFYGKAIYDRHPRTAIGYTADNKLIVFVCEGRSDSAAGLTLPQMARIMKEIGCYEALNLDGGGSTCLLVNGKEVNTPSSKGEQRAVPSVFMIKSK